MKKYSFKEALPVWEKGEDKSMNYHLVFRSIIAKKENVVVAVSASNMYQMFVNGVMVEEGPARAGHGYYRVDEVNISKYLTKEENVVAFFVAGYYVENFYLIKQPSFFCCEIIADGEVIASTGKRGFVAKYNGERIRKVARFSYQRAFSEYYVLNGENQDFIMNADARFKEVVLEETENKSFLTRGVPYPKYDRVSVDKAVTKGTILFRNELANTERHPMLNRFVTPTFDCEGYDLDDVEFINSDEVEKGIYTKTEDVNAPFEPTALDSDEYIVYKFKCINCGFIKLEVEASEDCQLLCAFDELDVDGDVDTQRLPSTIASIIWNFKAGKYTLIANEPYIVHYMKLINRSAGKLKINYAGMIEYKFPLDVKPLNSGNENLDKIYLAAVETFRQNTLDIYMDCASRERAGWLCDSFFTSRVEKALTGKSLVEKNFLENFLMPESFKYIEKGMLPMCYPADFPSGEFIPNWAMWYVLELEEYFGRTGDKELVDMAKKKVFELLQYFEEFENEDGLLEKLRNWIFVEWSPANDFVRDVSYPTNMLYARMLEAVGKLYDSKYFEKAKKIKEVINKQSFFDGFYHDHAMREEDGTLRVVKKDITETCQYYAFYMGCATKETKPELFRTLIEDFGAKRSKTGKWAEIHPSNVFIGNYLRLDILCREKLYDEILVDVEGFFTHMQERTGTLWELLTTGGTCCHGFASHVIVWLHTIFNKPEAF